MTDHTENSLRAVASSLRTIVAPAVDGSDPLAQQQLQLAIAYLDFLRERLPHLPDRDRFELRHNLRLAEAVREVVQPQMATPRLGEAIRTGQRLAVTAGASRTQLRRAAAILAAHVSELVSSDLDEHVRLSIERTVLDSSPERIEFERAWYQPMGFDPNPASATPLRALLPE